MKKTNKSPRELLRKSHSHPDKKNDYKRPTPTQENTWRDEIEGCPRINPIDWEKLPDNTGGVK